MNNPQNIQNNLIIKYLTSPMKSIAKIISTFFYSGFLKPASGTWGTLFGLIFFYLMQINTLSLLLQSLITLIIFVLSIFAIQVYTKSIKIYDAKQIVVDEVLGIFVSIIISYHLLCFFHASSIFSKPLIFLSINTLQNSVFSKLFYIDVKFVGLFILLNFVFFRIFDILKPYPCNFFDKKIKNAFGVIMDDIVAGFYSSILTTTTLVICNYFL